MKFQFRYICILFVFAIGCPLLSDAQTVDSLSHYLQVAGQNNRNVKADFLQYQASLQKIPQAGAYQDPQLDMGFFLKPMQLVNGRQVADFKLMQMFPWFGTRRAARSEAEQMAQMSFEKFRETRDNLFLDVYLQWFELCDLQEQLKNSVENKTLLDQLHSLALAKYASPRTSSYAVSSQPVYPKKSVISSTSGSNSMSMGKTTVPASNNRSMLQMSSSSAMTGSAGSMSDVLRIELEQAELDNDIQSLESDLKGEKGKFNALLNRDPATEVLIPDSLIKIPFLLDTRSAEAQISARNPMLKMVDAETKSYEAKAQMVRKMSYPMFGIGLEYMLINKNSTSSSMSSSSSSMGGMDMVVPMVSVSIPLYRNKYKAQQREAELLRQASLDRKVATEQTLSADLFSKQQQLDNADREISLMDKQTKLALATFQLAMQEFASGKGDLSNVIQIRRQLLDYQLKKSQAIAKYNGLVASIQKLLSFEIDN